MTGSKTVFPNGITANVIGQVFGNVNTYVANGAIALTDTCILLDATTATTAMTLADGTKGQIMYIKAINVTNAVTVVPANFKDGTTLTFDTVNEGATLLFDGTNWNLISNNGGAVT